MTLSDAQTGRCPKGHVAPPPHQSRASPNYPDRLSGMPCLLPRWIEQVLSVMAIRRAPAPGSSLFARPSLLIGQVGIHDFPFEACSSFTHVTACQIAHPPKVDFVHEAPVRPVPRPDGSQATESYRQLLMWVSHPLVIRAFGAHR